MIQRLLVAVVVAATIMTSTRAEARERHASRAVRTVTSSVRPVALRGLLALRGHMRHAKAPYLARLTREAKEVVAEPGNSWMPVHILLGIAITESDLRYWLKRGYGTVADCGITQINLPSLRMSLYKRRKLCRALRRKTGTKLSMQWTMKEMRRIKAKYCNATWLARIKRYHRWTRLRKLTDRQHFFRCVLTVYNQGPQWVTYNINTCTFKPERFGPSRAYLARKTRKCRSRNLYWLRTWCFAEGIRLGKAPMYSRRGRLRRASCRRVGTMAYVQRLYRYTVKPTSALTQTSSAARMQGSRVTSGRQAWRSRPRPSTSTLASTRK